MKHSNAAMLHWQAPALKRPIEAVEPPIGDDDNAVRFQAAAAQIVHERRLNGGQSKRCSSGQPLLNEPETGPSVERKAAPRDALGPGEPALFLPYKLRHLTLSGFGDFGDFISRFVNSTMFHYEVIQAVV